MEWNSRSSSEKKERGLETTASSKDLLIGNQVKVVSSSSESMERGLETTPSSKDLLIGNHFRSGGGEGSGIVCALY